ncbi:amino acid adenylation domain-containing protein [Micromonospora sp. NPDC005686]|uniref:amino acid adenylation domain-containing protein n=1 Tax=unclassified Micromonospora TaxID=2617518 RepID=UPI0033A082E3
MTPENPAERNSVIIGFVDGDAPAAKHVADAAADVLAHHTPEVVHLEHDGPADGFEDHARRAARELGRPRFDPAVSMRLLLLTDGSALRAVAVVAPPRLIDTHGAGRLLDALLARADDLCTNGPAPGRATDGDDRNPDGASRTESWAERLAGVPTDLEIPADRPRTGDPSVGRLPLHLPAATTEAVRDRAGALAVGAPAFLLAAFGLTLGRTTGADTLLVGVPSRVGDLLPVRIEITDDRSPAEFVRAVHESLAWSTNADGVSLPRLAHRLGAAESPAAPVRAFLSAPDEPGESATGAGRVRVEELTGGVPRFDIGVRFGQDGPGHTGLLEYAAGRWSDGEAHGFALGFVAAVDELVEATGDDAMTLADVRCISPAGRKILERINATDRSFPATSLDALFRARAADRPDAVAVRDEDSALTYAELAAAAAEQARLLRAAGVREGDAVLVGVQRSVAEAVAVLGTLWAGAAYIGVDLTQPAAHTARIVAKAAPAAAIVGEDDVDAVAPHAVPVVGPWRPDRAPAAPPAPPVTPDPDRVAYIAFTSGSTGEPKGVVVPHRGVIRLVHDADYLMLGPEERVLRLSPLAFDASTLELWGSLLSGATLEVCPPGLVSPGELGEFIAERRVTVAWLTAGLFRLVQEIAPASLGTLRHLLSGGDVVPHEHVARALADHPGLTFTNGYGPTENTTFTTYHPVRSPRDVDGPLPIGTPVPGTRVYVLDRRARLLAPGAVGELYTGGDGLAVGYVNDPEETDRCFGRFSPDVPERIYRTGDLVRIDHAGSIRFLGRADHQVKIRGYRIELTAIADALNGYPEVEDAVVTVADGTTADKRLLAAVRLTPGTDVTPVDLRGRLAERFPSFMVPSLWAVVDRMPVTANGKIDRRALAAGARPANAFARRKAVRQA